MTDKMMQISFLPQDIKFVRDFLQGKSYSNIISYKNTLDSISIDLTCVENYEALCSGITDLIINIIRQRDLKHYIWKTYTNIEEEERKSIYIEAQDIFDKKQDFINNTIYSKVYDFILDNDDLNLDGFFKFRMKDFIRYISIISDIALEEHLIKRDKREFLDSLKYFIEIQENKMELLRITITKENNFILSDEDGNHLENLNNEEMLSIAMEENLSNEDILISAIMTLCPKKIEIIDKSNCKKSKDLIDMVKLLFEGKLTVIYSN